MLLICRRSVKHLRECAEFTSSASYRLLVFAWKPVRSPASRLWALCVTGTRCWWRKSKRKAESISLCLSKELNPRLCARLPCECAVLHVCPDKERPVAAESEISHVTSCRRTLARCLYCRRAAQGWCLFGSAGEMERRLSEASGGETQIMRSFHHSVSIATPSTLFPSFWTSFEFFHSHFPAIEVDFI